MRFSPTRIALAALACIVGAVLALPLLLARKSDACGVPLLAHGADGGAGIGRLVRNIETQRESLGKGGLELANAADGGGPDPSQAQAPRGGLVGPACEADAVGDLRSAEASPDPTLPHQLEALADHIDRLMRRVAQAAIAWLLPEPLILIERRMYHLRP